VGTSLNQQVIIAAAGSMTFFVVTPVVAGSLGYYFACTNIGCALGTSAITGATSGASAAAVSGGLGSYYFKSNSRKWLKENVGRKIVNSQGKVEIVRALAFIGVNTLGSNSSMVSPIIRAIGNIPTWSIYVVPSAYSFISNYICTRRKLKKIKLVIR
jgi:hypothetical protein